jgi:hypothetical protein
MRSAPAGRGLDGSGSREPGSTASAPCRDTTCVADFWAEGKEIGMHEKDAGTQRSRAAEGRAAPRVGSTIRRQIALLASRSET